MMHIIYYNSVTKFNQEAAMSKNVSNIPKGYKIENGKLVVNEQEAKLIKEAYESVNNGESIEHTTSELAQKLHEL